MEQDKVKIANGKLTIKEIAVKDMFQPVISKMISHLKDLFQNPNVSNIKTIFVVGGFGQCAALQHQIKQAFGTSRRVLIPEEANLCVLKGAVMFGHQPNFITTRIAKYTYALLLSRDPKPSDPASRICEMPGGGKYVETLHALITRGQSIPLNHIEMTTTEPRSSDQEEVDVTIYSSDQYEVEDPSDPSIQMLGEITTHVSRSFKNRQITVQLIFGGTEIKVRGITTTGTIAEAVIDMLH